MVFLGVDICDFCEEIQAFHSDKRYIFLGKSRYFQHTFSCTGHEKYMVFTEITRQTVILLDHCFLR